ncbi:hypothetical protein LTR17_026380 [Elasticomyces elasticus]|nr:hypothetical protein LTR17_026380 [Elasticomyces elasticus]
MAGSTLPETMKAQVLEQFNQPYVLRSLPLPQLASDSDLLIKVDAARALLYPYPQIPRESLKNTVSARKSVHLVSSYPRRGVSRIKSLCRDCLATGQPTKGLTLTPITLGAYHPCGTCFECADTTRTESDHAGYSVFCSKANNNGINRNGGFSEYAVVDARQVALLPEEISPVDAAPLMCAGITIFGALKRCKLERGQRVGIVGAGGGLGHLGLQFATAMGLRTVGVDAADAPLQLARNLKTDAQIVDARTEKAELIVQHIGEEDGESENANMGLDAVIILPEGQSGFDYGMKLLKNHGICVVVSFPEAGFHMSARDLVFRDITVTGSLVSSNKTLHEMLDFAAKHNVKAVSKTFPLDNLNGLVEEYNKAAGGKLVVDMSL